MRMAKEATAYDATETVIGTVTLTVETQIQQPIFKGSESIGQTIDFMISEFYAGNPEGILSQLHLDLKK